jgi:hypothetical protein
MLRYTYSVCLVEYWNMASHRGEDRFDSDPFRVEFVVNKATLWQLFSPSASVFLCHYHSSSTPFSSTCCSFQTDKWAKPGNLPKCNALYKPLSPISWNSDLQTTSTDKHQLCQIWGPNFHLRGACWYEGSEVICWPVAFIAKCVRRPWLQYPRQRRG